MTLTIDSLVVGYGKRNVVKGASLEIRKASWSGCSAPTVQGNPP